MDNSLTVSRRKKEERIAAGEHYVIRFKTPVNEILD